MSFEILIDFCALIWPWMLNTKIKYILVGVHITFEKNLTLLITYLILSLKILLSLWGLHFCVLLILDLLLIFLVKTKRTFTVYGKTFAIFLSFSYLQWPSDQGPKKYLATFFGVGKILSELFFGNNCTKHRLCMFECTHWISL